MLFNYFPESHQRAAAIAATAAVAAASGAALDDI